ncbi:MAG TPA: glutamine synthetase type III, partial [Candidatus Blautia avistercoris]|nr:glutamine synthetase type III [Candidatus Blautia avistercoris]
FLPQLSVSCEEKLVTKLSDSYAAITGGLEKLTADTKAAEALTDVLEASLYYRRTILKDMEELRSSVDAAERLIPDDYLPYPTYDRLLFSI